MINLKSKDYLRNLDDRFLLIEISRKEEDKV
jgi:hypothetical protein